MTGTWVRFTDLEGNLLLTGAERAEEERERAERQRERAQQERERAEEERGRAEQGRERARQERGELTRSASEPNAWSGAWPS